MHDGGVPACGFERQRVASRERETTTTIKRAQIGMFFFKKKKKIQECVSARMVVHST